MAATDLANYIFGEVGDIVRKEFNGSWPKSGLGYILLSLEPDKPEDGSKSFVSYEVPGKKRAKLKTGKFLVRKLELNKGFLNDKQIADLADKIDRYMFPKRKTKLCKGKEITKNYKKEIGGHSCMTNHKCYCTKLYEINPERFSQLVMFYGSTSGRAIVHKLDCGKLFMDRIYTDSYALAKDMIEYAIKEDWAYRISEGKYIIGISGIDTDKLIVSNLNYKDGEVPYMDTLRCYNISEDGKLSIFHKDVDRKSQGCLDSIDGYIVIEEDEEVCCDYCGDYVNEMDTYNVGGDIYCERCFSEHCIVCEHCGEYEYVDSAVHIEDRDIWTCMYCARRYNYRCSDCGYWFSEELYHGEYCRNCLENHIFCEDCGMEVDEVNDDGLCTYCAENSEEDNETMQIPFKDV